MRAEYFQEREDKQLPSTNGSLLMRSASMLGIANVILSSQENIATKLSFFSL